MWNLKHGTHKKSRMVVARDKGRGGREMLIEVYEPPFIRGISAEDVKYSMVTAVNKTVLYT